MRYYGLDLNLLTVLEALYVEQHVTRAAGRLHLTQSAVSASLGRLREHFEDPLFVLVGGSMLPSPLMQELYPRILTVLGTAREIASANVRFDPATASRRLRIMASDYVIAVLMPQVQRLLAQIAPQVELHLLTLTPLEGAQIVRTVDDALEHRHCDLVIIPHVHRSRHHPDEALFQDPFSVIAWRDNQRVAEGLSLDTYLGLPHVVRETGVLGQGSMEAEYLTSMNLERRVAVSVEQFGLIPEFVEGSQCIATLHSRLARLYARRFHLKLLEPPIPIPPTLQVMQWHAYQDVDPALIWMRQLLRDAAAESANEHAVKA